MKDGLGCDIPAAAEKAQGKPVPDHHLNEHATGFNLKDRGLIVISSCGRSGIVNSTRQEMKESGVDKVHAIWAASVCSRQTRCTSSRRSPRLIGPYA